MRARINTTDLGYDDSRSSDGDNASFAFLQVLSGFLQKICTVLQILHNKNQSIHRI
jgi:hypothetical protein